MTFGEEAVKSTVSKLLSGNDYRDEVINAVNCVFFDFSIKFFREIVGAKINGHDINLEWYRERFIDGENIPIDELCRMAGVPKRNIDKNFTRDKNLPYDRETDYKLINQHINGAGSLGVQASRKHNHSSGESLSALYLHLAQNIVLPLMYKSSPQLGHFSPAGLFHAT